MRDSSSKDASLLRVFGLAFGLAVVVGGMVGSGILRAPGVVAQGFSNPDWFLAAWAAGGVLSLLSAMPLVEAASSVAQAGGAYPIARRAFGPIAAFFVGWITWLSYAIINAFIAVVFGEYLHRLGIGAGVSNSVLAVLLIVTVTIINAVGARVSGASQGIASATKGVAFLVLIAILFLTPRAPVADLKALARQGLGPGVTAFSAAVMAMRVIYQTYAGWDAAIYFSEEVKRPDREIARSTFGGIIAVTVLYVVVNAALLHVLPPTAIAGSPLALGDAIRVRLGASGDTALTALALFSLASVVNLQIMAAPRITFRMAKDGALPSALGRVSASGAPRVGVVVAALAACVFAATGSYESLVRIYAPWGITGIVIVCLAAIRLRFVEPDLARPWKMPFFPWLALIVTALQLTLVAIVVWDDPGAALCSTLVALAPLPIYALVLRARRRRTVSAALSETSPK